MRPLRPHLVHVFASFEEADAQMRTAALINYFGTSFRHTVIALDRCFETRQLISPDLDIGVIGPPSPLRVRRVVRLQAQLRLLAPDLLLTYGWDTLWVALLNRLSRLAPLIHHEDVPGGDGARGREHRRMLLRRLLLAQVDVLVVPSHELAEIAAHVWRVRSDRLVRIPHGVKPDDLTRPARPDPVPGLERQPGELIVGTLAHMRRADNLERLVRVFARCLRQARARLVVIGDGPERRRIAHAIAQHQVEAHVLLPGRLPDPARFFWNFDVFASSADAAYMPCCLLRAMAAGLPIIATEVGDVKDMVSEPNRDFVIAPRNEAAFTAKLDALLRDGQLRLRLGRANRQKAATDFPFAATAAAFDSLYRRVLEARAPA